MESVATKQLAIYRAGFACLLCLIFLAGCGGGHGDATGSQGTAAPSTTSPPGSTGNPGSAQGEADLPAIKTSNDEFLSEQWALLNAGQTIGGKVNGAPGSDIRILRAWSLTQGNPEIVVAVIDSGVALDHPDLAPNIWTNPGESGNGRENNGIDDDGNGYVDDIHGWNYVDNNNNPRDARSKSILDAESNIYHGTAVASIIAAVADNQIGMAGIAPKVRIMPLRVLSEGGLDDNFAKAVFYARDNGARIINLSVATFIPGLGFPKLAQAIKDSPNVLVVASAGNAGNDADIIGTEPCTDPAPNIICVAATDEQDRLSQFLQQGSNYGKRTVDIAAPGSNMLVAQPPTDTIFVENFDSDQAALWTAGGPNNLWRFSSETTLSGIGSLSYTRTGSLVSGTDFVRMNQPIDLTGKHGCMLEFWVNNTIPNNFLLSLQGSIDGRNYAFIVGAQGFQLSAATPGGWQQFQVPMTFFSAAGKAYLGFAFTQTSTTGDGGRISIDDLKVTCTGEKYNNRNYAYAEGTSFAAPAVSGVAALAFSYKPNASVAQVKNALWMGGMPVPSLFGKIRVPVRLDAYRTLQALDLAPSESIAEISTKTGFKYAAAGTTSTPHTANSQERAGNLIFSLNLPLPVALPFFAVIEAAHVFVYNKQASYWADPQFVSNDVSFKNNRKYGEEGGEVPPQLDAALKKYGISIQHIGKSPYCVLGGCPVAFDRYGIGFDVAPGSATNAKDLFEKLLRELPSGFSGNGVAGTLVKGINNFNYVDPATAGGKQRPEVGSLIHINIIGEDQIARGADVIIAEINDKDPKNLSFTVLTVNNPDTAGGHPVWGAREFRVTQDGNKISISTSGTDSPGNPLNLVIGTSVQAIGWLSFRESVAEQLQSGAIPGYVPNSVERTASLQYLPALP